jgi:hypothetical protein
MRDVPLYQAFAEGLPKTIPARAARAAGLIASSITMRSLSLTNSLSVSLSLSLSLKHSLSLTHTHTHTPTHTHTHRGARRRPDRVQHHYAVSLSLSLYMCIHVYIEICRYQLARELGPRRRGADLGGEVAGVAVRERERLPPVFRYRV